MPRMEGDLETQTEIECADLIGFSCGDGRLGAVEDEVDELVNDIYAGQFPDAVLRVTREMPAGMLVGIAAVESNKGPQIEQIPVEENRDAAFIVVVALSNKYRGRKTSKQGQSLSGILIFDALRYLAEANGGTVPPIQGVIGNSNMPSRELAAQYGFECVLSGIGASFYVRPRGHPLPRVPESAASPESQ
jgi:hypothetical protein